VKENMKQKNNLKSLDQFVDEQYGKKGTIERDKLDKGYEAFKSITIQGVKPTLKENYTD